MECPNLCGNLQLKCGFKSLICNPWFYKASIQQWDSNLSPTNYESATRTNRPIVDVIKLFWEKL